MKNVYLLLALAILMTGCSSRYYVATVNHPDTILHSKVIELSDIGEKEVTIEVGRVSFEVDKEINIKYKVYESSKETKFNVREIKLLRQWSTRGDSGKGNLALARERAMSTQKKYKEISYVFVNPNLNFRREPIRSKYKSNPTWQEPYKRRRNSDRYNTHLYYGKRFKIGWFPSIILDSCNSESSKCEPDSKSFFEGMRYSVGSKKDYYVVMYEKFRRTSHEDLETWRSLISGMILKYDLADDITVKTVNKKLSPDQDIKVLGLPNGMTYDLENGNISIGISNDNYAFSRTAIKKSINSKYYGLLPDYTTNRAFQLTLAHSSGQKRHLKPNYYDATDLYAEIRRLENLGSGFVRFTSNVTDVEIYVDGVNRGNITSKPFVAKLLEGKYLITAKKNMFGSKSINVNVAKDDAFAYHFELISSGNMSETMGTGKITQATGQLVVLTSRNDVSINIDGTVRLVPVKMPNFAAGDHTASVKYGNRSTIVRFSVKPNEKTVVNLDDYLP